MDYIVKSICLSNNASLIREWERGEGGREKWEKGDREEGIIPTIVTIQ